MADDIAEAPLHRRARRTRSSARGRTAGTRSTCSGRPTAPGCSARTRVDIADRPALFVLDMFPYPSGNGLHVGHPLGYIATDVYARFQRMNGFNVLHAMGYDAFGLPAEQYAVQTGHAPERHDRAEHRQHEAAAARARPRSRSAPGPGDDRRRRTTAGRSGSSSRSTTPGTTTTRTAPARSPSSCRSSGRRPRPTPDGHPVRRRSSRSSSAQLVDSYRLAYIAEAPVNWCPGLGTVLANEEVTADGRSDRGNFPVYRRPLKQWMLRITAYADRLLADLDVLDWSDSIKLMQRNWIGRSTGALVRFPVRAIRGVDIEVFTTRPDTLFGATYMVLAPEHPLVDDDRADRVAGRRASSAMESNPSNVEGRVRLDEPPAEAVRALPRLRRREDASSSARPRHARRRACSPAPSRSTRRTASGSRSSSPTTC